MQGCKAQKAGSLAEGSQATTQCVSPAMPGRRCRSWLSSDLLLHHLRLDNRWQRPAGNRLLPLTCTASPPPPQRRGSGGGRPASGCTTTRVAACRATADASWWRAAEG